MDIFQQWLLIKIEEQHGAGANPLEKEISFESILSMLKPIFEQEGAPLDEEDIRRNLNELVTSGHLSTSGETYFLTLRGMIYAQTAPSLAQMVKAEIQQYIRLHWWKALGLILLLIVGVTLLIVNLAAK
ncbi:MAG: hypothetical protein JNM02_13590 [Anaerolineales bacterium]|nr:hypothetical protein [Anaerolineales bacterium]